MVSRQETELMAHLMRRAGFGASRDEIEERVARGYEETVEDLLNPEHTQRLGDDVIRRYHADIHESRLPDPPATEWLYRMVTTSSPLEEKIALFWHGVFASSFSKTQQARSLAVQIDMFRRFGLGRFDTLLLEISRDPIMLMWLDNQDNHNGAINENFGRELIELFSMGIGNYTEDDIKQCARAFTGWTVGNAEYMAARAMKASIWPYGAIAWHFDYRDHDHDHGEKEFLGESGPFNGEDIIEIIARQPATARFIARHIYDFFVADEAPVPQWPYTPPLDADAIETLAGVYVDSGHDIRSMLRVLFNSDFFKEAQFARVKCPAEFVAGAMRLGGGVSEPTLAMNEANAVIGYMGQSLLAPPSVEGWHEGTEWINSGALVERVNFAAKQFNDIEKPGVRQIIDRLANENGSIFTPEDLVDNCLDLMGPLTKVEESTRNALVCHVSKKGDVSLRPRTAGESDSRIAELLGLIAATKEFHRA
ncbi:MAG: DUF1800 domain-containing protein [Chloroflexi bacterium]|nr:DUF1800 domain-containing protein [Chloroflexota bacterium]